MLPVLLGSVLSLLFFSAVLMAESGGDSRRKRDLVVIIGILALVAAYASHALVSGGDQVASLTSMILPGG